MRLLTSLLLVAVVFISACTQTRIHDQPELAAIYKNNGISDACFMLRDHTHESIYFYNKDRCLRRFSPASTFKIFNSLVGLETATAPDDQYIIKWDGVHRSRLEWNKDMNMREAFKVSNVAYYQELARRIGRNEMQHYLDTVKYGNARIGAKLDEFWLNDTLQITADEQVGFIKRLYFDELPFSERSQRIVRSMMLQEDMPNYKLYYKTGTQLTKDTGLYWIVGFVEKIEEVTEDKNSMNKSNQRNYPYFFAQNFSVPLSDTSRNWFDTRLKVLHEVIDKMVLQKN